MEVIRWSASISDLFFCVTLYAATRGCDPSNARKTMLFASD